MNGTLHFLRRWWFLITALVALGSWAAKIQAEVDGKADIVTVLDLQRSINEIKLKLDDMDTRQRLFFCRDQPPWCR